jgi:RNA polymerase sigma-70 factor (ECF subfamily)
MNSEIGNFWDFFDQLVRSGGKMGTAPNNPCEAYIPRAGVVKKRGSSNVGSNTGRFLDSQLPSQSNGNACNCAFDEPDDSDDNLTTAAQRGDQQAFVELCRRHSSVVKRKILLIVRNQADAEDALQDALLRAYTCLTSFRRSCKFSTWLTTIGVNSALMIVRKRRVRRETYPSANCPDAETFELQNLVDQSLGPEGIYLKGQTVLLVRRAVKRLHPSLRSVVRYYYETECSVEEAAKVQEISVAAAKSRLSRGRARLRSSLERCGISNP